MKCQKTGNCTIDFTTRKSCPQCRLLKAISLGMTFKGKSAQKIFLKLSPPSSSISSQQLSTSLDDLIIKTIKDNSEIELQKLKVTDIKNTFNLTTNDLLNIPRKENPKKYATCLTHLEKKIIAELTSSLATTFTDERTLPCVAFTSLADTYNWPATYAKRVSKFCRSLPAFNDLPFADQLVILRSAYIYVLAMRAYFAFDHTLNGYYILADETGSGSLFLGFKLAENQYEQKWLDEATRMMTLFQTVMEGDETIRDLLIGFFLFRGSPPYFRIGKLQNLELVTFQQHRYLYLLYRYFEHKWVNVKIARQKFSATLKVIATFENLTARSKVLLQEIDVSLFSDLLKEIYEL